VFTARYKLKLYIIEINSSVCFIKIFVVRIFRHKLQYCAQSEFCGAGGDCYAVGIVVPCE
jgi:hypothetical protein